MTATTLMTMMVVLVTSSSRAVVFWVAAGWRAGAGCCFGTTNSWTSSLGGKLDFGIGMKSWLVQLSGRKWEDGCSDTGFSLFRAAGDAVASSSLGVVD